jgi:ABC-type sugar transport system permease subunit
VNQRTAVFLIGFMGCLAIGIGYVMVELYAQSWGDRAVEALAVAPNGVMLAELGTRRRIIQNQSEHRLSRRLHIRADEDGSADASRLLTLNLTSDIGWAHAWLHAQSGERILRDGGHVYFMESAPAGVLVSRTQLSNLPRPELSKWACTFGVMGLLLWMFLVNRSPSRGSVLTGATIFAAVWLGGILEAVEMSIGGVETDSIIGNPASRIGEVMLILSAVLVPIVVASSLGAVRRGIGSPHRAAYAYLGPAVSSMLVLVFIPFALGVGLAFTRYVDGTYVWVGFDNFIHILSNEGLSFTHPLSFYFTLGVTVLWTVLNVCFHASLGLGLALVLNRPTLRFKSVYRVLLIVPWAVPSYITALVWHGMFSPTDGFINACLSACGLAQVGWFNGFWTAFSANLITNTWLGFPFMMVVSLGALQSIPKDLYEAAQVDGASKWACFKSITLPLLRPALLPAIILGAVWTFNMFNVIYLVSGGAPSNQTDILITEAYRWAFEKDRYGYAAAYSMLIFMILLGYGYVTQRLSRSSEEEAA